MKRKRDRSGRPVDRAAEAVDTACDSSIDYLLDEYEHVAQAHFQTITSISAFFKHYLVIMAVPITLASVALAFAETAPLVAPTLAAVVLSVVAFAGLCVFAYIVNLRLDVMLYARTINAIRRYFMDRLEGSPLVGESVRVLPKNRRIPPYHEVRFFYPVALSFALIDGAYLALAAGLLYRTDPYASLFAASAVGFAFAWVHLLVYRAQAHHREATYLSARVIGVDLDGVVNRHREKFCEKLTELTGKVLDPEQINVIPVHVGENNAVTRADEIAVFNSPDYWTDVVPVDRAADILMRLQDELGYEVRLFTRRDWPETKGMTKSEAQDIREVWKAAAVGDRKCLSRLATSMRDPIRVLTGHWLQSHGMGQFPLTVEKKQGRWTVLAKNRNRFLEARSGRFHMFVEDDPDNATRLAQLCDLVLLIEHPYNSGRELPSNVVRVSGWPEIWHIVCALPSSQ